MAPAFGRAHKGRPTPTSSQRTAVAVCKKNAELRNTAKPASEGTERPNYFSLVISFFVIHILSLSCFKIIRTAKFFAKVRFPLRSGSVSDRVHCIGKMTVCFVVRVQGVYVFTCLCVYVFTCLPSPNNNT
jgi:hypothetical protein